MALYSISNSIRSFLPTSFFQALAVAMAYQAVTNHHKQRPPINDLGPNDKIPDPVSGSTYPSRVLGIAPSST